MVVIVIKNMQHAIDEASSDGLDMLFIIPCQMQHCVRNYGGLWSLVNARCILTWIMIISLLITLFSSNYLGCSATIYADFSVQ